MGEEVVLEALQQKGSATGLTGELRVVEECTHALAGQEVGLHGSQGGRDPEGKKGRHERVQVSPERHGFRPRNPHLLPAVSPAPVSCSLGLGRGGR